MRSATSRAALSRAMLADVSARWLGELCGAAFDRLLLRAHGQGGHPSALQSQHAPVADHLPRDARAPDRVPSLRRPAPARRRAGRARVEDGVLLGQLRLDAILDRALGLPGARVRRSAAPPHPGRTRDRGRSVSTRAAGRARVVSSSRGGSRARGRAARRVRVHGRSLARKRSAARATSRERPENASRSSLGDTRRSRSTGRPCRCPARSHSPPRRARRRARSGRTRRAPERSGRSAATRPRRSGRPRGPRR